MTSDPTANRPLLPGPQDYWSAETWKRHGIEWWWVDSKAAYAAVGVRNGEIVLTAPVFEKLIGRKITQIAYRKGLLTM